VDTFNRADLGEGVPAYRVGQARVFSDGTSHLSVGYCSRITRKSRG
jgi:hypothetical protein